MRVLTSVAQMQRLARRWQQQRATIGFVPTMGSLHEGHLSLVRRARHAVGARGKVVVSIYVNPTQFGPKEDLAKYPRDLKRDLALCRRTGADVVFNPSDRAMYADRQHGGYTTYVVEDRLSQVMEGRSRPGHFRGVTTIVAKLLNIVHPDVAVFGAKDWQQAAVVRRMVRNLNFPLKLIVAPTLREPDGLAMSSRNRYLTPEHRQQATVLWRALRHSKQRVRSKALPADRLRREVLKLIHAEPSARMDYMEFFEGATLEPVKQVQRGSHMALAVWIGKTRLIDNAKL